MRILQVLALEAKRQETPEEKHPIRGKRIEGLDNPEYNELTFSRSSLGRGVRTFCKTRYAGRVSLLFRPELRLLQRTARV